jgi:hypothetical protein
MNFLNLVQLPLQHEGMSRWSSLSWGGAVVVVAAIVGMFTMDVVHCWRSPMDYWSFLMHCLCLRRFFFVFSFFLDSWLSRGTEVDRWKGSCGSFGSVQCRFRVWAFFLLWIYSVWVEECFGIVKFFCYCTLLLSVTIVVSLVTYLSYSVASRRSTERLQCSHLGRSERPPVNAQYIQQDLHCTVLHWSTERDRDRLVLTHLN